jgi:transposase-like protein
VVDALVVLDHPNTDSASPQLDPAERSHGPTLVPAVQAAFARCIFWERIVQLDEAYGRGWCLMMAKQVGTRKLAYTVLEEEYPNRQQAAHFLFQKIRPGSELWTEGAKIYQGIDAWWPVIHSRDIHKKFEFEHTSEIEGMFGDMRTFIRRMYHHVEAEQFPEYVREFCFRFYPNCSKIRFTMQGSR